MAFQSTESIRVCVLCSLCVSRYGQGLNLDLMGTLEVKLRKVGIVLE